jgi:hypothetical protein
MSPHPFRSQAPDPLLLLKQYHVLPKGSILLELHIPPDNCLSQYWNVDLVCLRNFTVSNKDPLLSSGLELRPLL